MALYIVQHGQSLPKDIDPERGLSEQGRREVERIAGVAKGYRVKVTTIIHSGKKRARETAEILASALNPAVGIFQRDGFGPHDDVPLLAGTLDPDADHMLVGHLPFLEKLIAYLITGKTDPPIFKLQNGGILCMNRQGGTWVILWALMPHIGSDV